MKINIDTENKVITLDEDVNLHEFYEEINTLLSDGKWRSYTLRIKTKIFDTPTIVTPHTIINPYQPIPNFNPPPTIYCGDLTYSDNTTLDYGGDITLDFSKNLE